MNKISIRSILALVITLLCFSILLYTLIKHGDDKGTLNLITGSAITGISLIGGYYFQASHRPVNTEPTNDLLNSKTNTQDELFKNPGGPVEQVQ